jgi:hypothetical protein
MGFTTVPLPAAVSSPVANHSRRRATCGMGMRLGLPGIDWWRWLSLRWLRRTWPKFYGRVLASRGFDYLTRVWTKVASGDLSKVLMGEY